jgi:simple sugar transport system ATP-binding protein
VRRFDVRTPSPLVPVSTLSGGNQQKVIIARELSGEVRLLIVAQPTRGLDVGSIEFIHRRIIEMRDQGAAVLLVSAELDEILNLSDRIGVLYRGALVGVFDRADATRDELGLLMASGREPGVEEPVA